MLHQTLVQNARLSDRQGFYHLVVSNTGIIQNILPDDSTGDTSQFSRAAILDVEGDWISLGGVDLQINGALGLAFPDLCDYHADALLKIGRFLWEQGIDGFLPTLVTTSIENIHRALGAIATARETLQTTEESATILGVHLEGPCLNPEKRGAHPQEHLQPLTLDTVKRVLGDYAPMVTVMTLAPELDPTGKVIPYLRSLGITVSLGHSQATADEADAAFNQGATMITHAFNAMPSLHHRKPGLLGAALTRPDVFCGLIADGQHVCPTMLDVLMRTCRGGLAQVNYPQGVFLVSDALAPLGLPDGLYPWDTRQIEVRHGTARLDNGTLAGTTHPLLVGVQNLVDWGICQPGEAIALATIAPRRAIGRPGLEPGQPAHLLRWSLDEENRLSWGRLGTGE
jgi:N-acetylglucosamine-6-phosphate deacetylase